MASKVYQGSCLCRSVQYEITGEPFTFFICNCENCRKTSGSAFMANAFFQENQVVVTKGADVIKHYRDFNNKSGTGVTRSFCSECGSSLFLSGDKKKEWTIVATGTVHSDFDWAPKQESFPERRHDWLTGIAFKP